DEAVDALNRYAPDMELDPERLTALETHLSQLHDLARRHRVSAAQLPDKQRELERELEALEGAGGSLAALSTERDACLKRYQKAAKALGKRRREAASRLGKTITGLMQELGMTGGSFEVAITPQPDNEPDGFGQERCEFMVSANPGQVPR